MECLTHWRMLLAGGKLANSSDPISVIALSLGYESESAFSTAFKRIIGLFPTAISLWQESGFPFQWRGERDSRQSARTGRRLIRAVGQRCRNPAPRDNFRMAMRKLDEPAELTGI
jgi:hypothetical protein